MILVDSSVWIDHFRKGNKNLIELLEKEEVCTSEIILLELIPFLQQQKNTSDIVENLQRIPCTNETISKSDWKSLRKLQEELIQSGHNGIGIPDLIIVYTAIKYELPVFTLDKTLNKILKKHKAPLHSPD